MDDMNCVFMVGSIRITSSVVFWTDKNILSKTRSSSVKSWDRFRVPVVLVDTKDSPDRGVAALTIADRPEPLM
jgi:hypothetical protein